MTIEEQIYAILAATAAITAVCPADRIKPPGLYQNLTRPYIIYHPVSLNTASTVDATVSLRIWPDWQISVFSDSYSTGRTLAQSVVTAIDGHHALTSPATEGWRGIFKDQLYLYEPDTTVHHFALVFAIAEGLPY